MKTTPSFSATVKKVLLVSAMYLVCAPNFAGEMPRGGMQGMHTFSDAMPPYFSELDLSAEQQEKIKGIWATQSLETKGVWQQLRLNRETEQALIDAPKFDVAKAQKMAEADAKLMAKNNVAMMKSRHDIYQLLNTEQRAKLESIRLQKRQMMDNRMEGAQK